MSGLDSDDGGQQLLLGKMLLERGLITADQLREALVERAKRVAEGDQSATPLGGILVKKGFLTDEQLVSLATDGAPGETTRRRDAPPQPSGPQLPALPGQDNLHEGTQLGKYLLTRELGRGGMGVVFEAMDTQLQRKVALKLMLSNPNADPKERAIEEERFIQEAQLSARLKHPNIVTVYEAGLLEGRQFLAMELIEGTGFNEWRKQVPIKDQIRVIREVASAVHHAHEQGILHRDLKPRNILMGGTRPYVTDFGLAKSLGKSAHNSLTTSGAVVGTPAYMSPEQAQGLERVDWRTDIYSLGIILFECMTGRTPFVGESPIEILMKVVKDPVPPPLSLISGAQALGLDKGIEAICLKSVAKKDKDRYVTAQAFADDLTKWLAGEQVKVVLPKAPVSPMRRIYGLVGVLALSIAGLLGYFIWDKNRPPEIAPVLRKAAEFEAARNWGEAKVQYQLVLAMDPSNVKAKTGLLLMQKEIDLESERKLEQAREAMRKEYQEKLEGVKKADKDIEEMRRREAEAKDEEERRRLAKERQEAERVRAKLEEDARRAAKELERTRSLKEILDGGEDWKSAVNLFPLIDPARHAVWGSWEVRNVLLSGRRPAARIELPYQPPPEYDLRVLFERRTGAGGISLILVRDGQPFRAEIGGASNTRACIEILKDFKEVQTPVVVESTRMLENDRRYLLLAQVRKDGVKILLDGKPLLEWKTDFDNVGINPAWRLGSPQRLGLGSDESQAAFHVIELRELEGKGKPVPAGDRPLLRALPASPGRLEPGLVGEYFFGPDLLVPALRRVEPILDFDWGEGPAWVGGPSDHFSARFSGYLHVQNTARYKFHLKADDGAMLAIDDVQLIGAWNSRSDAAHTAEVSLQQGYHRIVVEYHESAFRASLSLTWQGGGGSPVPLGQKSILHVKTDANVFLAPRLTEMQASLLGHTNSVTAVAFSPKSRLLLSASEDRRVRFWDPAARKEEGRYATHGAGILSAAFSPDGVHFATGARDQRVKVWDLTNRSELRTLEGFSQFVPCIAFSPDGRLLAAGSFDRTLRIWEAPDWNERMLLRGHEGGVTALRFAHDGKRLVSGGADRSIRVWDVESGKALQVLQGHAEGIGGLAVSSDSALLYSGGADGLVKAWDLASGTELRLIGSAIDEIVGLTLSPDGRLLVAGGADGMIRVWDLILGTPPKLLYGHGTRVGALDFLPGSRLLASGGFDATVRLWNLE